MLDPISLFRDAIRAADLEPPDAIVPGKKHRFPGAGKRTGNTAGWCILFDDCQGGFFGDWSSGLFEHWQARRGKYLSHRDREARRRRVAEARLQAETERRARHAAAGTEALWIWSAAPSAKDDHPYLVRKGINANGVRLHLGRLLLPVYNFAGDLTSLQFIEPGGGKLLLKGGAKRGCFIPVAGEVSDTPTRVIICEGWATGCTLAAMEPDAVVLAAIDAGNLELVAVAARRRWPSANLAVAGDDDRLTPGNPGATKAHTAAIAANALLMLPQWPDDAPKSLTDFNDLAMWLERGPA